MLKPVILLLGVAFLCSVTTACKQEQSAAQKNAELLQAKKEDRKKRAAKYYNELVTKFPESEHAEEAKKRLQAIGPVGSPAPKK